MIYQIGEFSKIVKLTIKTLRYYHDIGLLSPTKIDNFTGYRYYEENLIEKAQMILTLKDFDFTLKEIKEILDNYKDDSEIIDLIKDKKEELSLKISRYKEIEKKLSNIIKDEEQIENIMKLQDIVIKKYLIFLLPASDLKGDIMK